MSFESEEEDLEEKFEEFGELVYCRIVVDPNTERSRGNESLRFICFYFFIYFFRINMQQLTIHGTIICVRIEIIYYILKI